jgi:diguanylate cyclase (GGDEF)-like protein/PAS domain S-box-containing protein
VIPLPRQEITALSPTAPLATTPWLPVRELAEYAARVGDPLVLLRSAGPGEALTVAWCSQPFLELTGYGIAELTGRPMTALEREGDDVDTPAWLPSAGEALRVLRCRDGRALRMAARIVSVGTAAAPAWFLRLRTRDESLRAEARLRASEDRFSALADQAPVGIFASEVGLRLGYVNERMTELLGRPESECLGTDWLDAVHPDDLATLLPALQGVLEGQPAELTLRGGVDADRRLQMTVVPVTAVDRGAGFVGTVQDVTERHAFESRLRQQATHDALTGLPNRWLLLERTAQSMQRAAAGGRVGLLFLDLDDFKLVNDSLGHALGDLLLRQVAARLAVGLRDEDLVARVGGDEFVVLCPGLPDDQVALDVAERLRGLLVDPFRLDGHEVTVGASIGVVLADGAQAAADLLRDADVAMYQAKSAGKDRAALFDVAVRSRLADRLHLLNDLRRAVQASEIGLVYQPVVAAADGSVRSVEALARWQHPTRGFVSPADFIPLAERSDLICALGSDVLRRACAQLAEWRRELGDLAPRTVSVNLSAVQLRSPGLVDLVRSALADAGLVGPDLCLELTESVLMHDPVSVSRQLDSLRSLGVRIAMDDFGTGYSSLAYLQQLPVDRLKLDRSLLAGLGKPGERSVIPAAVVLARGLELETVAEGVESADQLDRLRELGCEAVQGYHVCRPLPAPALAAWLRGRAATVREEHP